MIENLPGVIQSMPSQVPITNLQCWALKGIGNYSCLLGFGIQGGKTKRAEAVPHQKDQDVPVL